jgi:hypothetical protein
MAMIGREFQFHAELKNYGRAVCVYLFAPRDDGGTDCLMNLVFSRLPPDDCQAEAPIEISHKQAQQLMDELWRCGLRPSEGTGSAGSLAAGSWGLTMLKAPEVAALLGISARAVRLDRAQRLLGAA